MAQNKRHSVANIARQATKRFNRRRRDFLYRRPHRSFRLTRRRDYKRSLELPGYWSFTYEVWKTIKNNKWLFTKFIIIYSALSGLVLGMMSQSNYQLLNSTISHIGDTLFQGQVGALGQNLAIFSGVLSGAFNTPPSEAQQLYGGMFFLVGWLTLIWLLRQIKAGTKNLRVRDGIYSSGGPLVATFLILMVILIQLIPFALAIMAYVAAQSVDVFDDTFFTTLFWLVELLLIALSTFWLTSSLLGLVVVTLPGMYPLRALRSAGDLVTSRRLRILYRLLWLIITLLIIWLIAILPAIALSNIPVLKNVPIVPLVVLFTSSFSLVWGASYIYLLYRKLVDDDAKPA